MSTFILGIAILVALVSFGLRALYRKFFLADSQNLKKCPYCDRYYADDPYYCPHCGEKVNRDSNRR